MKVLFVYSNITCACTRKCCFELTESLNKYVVTKAIYFKEFNRKILMDYDIVIFQRVGTAGNVKNEDVKEILNIINENRGIKKFIYLIDDLVLEAENGTPKIFIQNCDAIICTSKTLERYIRVLNKNIYMFHTFINWDLYESIPSTKYDKLTLGWISTGGLGKDIVKTIISKREDIGREFNLIAIGGYSEELKGEKGVEIYPILNEYQMIEKVKGVDILLNPMSVSKDIEPTLNILSNGNIEDFINCKSEIKYAIAGAIKACLITSAAENYIKIIKNMVNGIVLNDSPQSWISMIRYLSNNMNIINKIAMNMYNDVKFEYSNQNVAGEFYNVLKEISSE